MGGALQHGQTGRHPGRGWRGHHRLLEDGPGSAVDQRTPAALQQRPPAPHWYESEQADVDADVFSGCFTVVVMVACVNRD